jgi:hypothetical protein
MELMQTSLVVNHEPSHQAKYSGSCTSRNSSCIPFSPQIQHPFPCQLKLYLKYCKYKVKRFQASNAY